MLVVAPLVAVHSEVSRCMTVIASVSPALLQKAVLSVAACTSVENLL
jgi:hypothetical protein